MALDNVTPLERIRLSGQLAAQVKALQSAEGAIARISAAKQVAELLQKLGAGSAEKAVQSVPVDTLIDVGLLKEWGGRWKYKSRIDSPAFFTAPSKGAAIERATAAYWKTSPEERKGRAQRDEEADRQEIEASHRAWGQMDIPSLRSLFEKMGGDIASLKGAAGREFNQNGGRRTAAAVAAEGVRQTAEERMRLGRYIEWRAAKAGIPEHWRDKLFAAAVPSDVVTVDQVRAKFEAKEGIFEAAQMRAEPADSDVAEQEAALKSARMGGATEKAAIPKYEQRVRDGLESAFDFLAQGWTMNAIGSRKQAAGTGGGEYLQRGNEYMNSAKQKLAEALKDAAFLEALKRRALRPEQAPKTLGDRLGLAGQADSGRAPTGDIVVGTEHRDPEQPEQTPQIIEHTTGRGKVIRGIVRTDLSYAEAKAIDEYTFRKSGPDGTGYFIREKHLEGYVPGDDPPEKAERTPEEIAQAEADRLANEQLRAEKRRNEQVAKLRAVAQSTIDKAEEELGRDRLSNTARRARMAASANAGHESARAIGKTMLNLADAIESGKAKHMAGITSRAAVEALQDSLRSAMYEAEKGLSYADQQRQKGRAPTIADVEHAKFPLPVWGTAGTSLAGVLEAIKGKKGSVELAKKIRYSPGPDAEMIRELKAMIGEKETGYQIGWWNLEQVAKVARLQRAGISNAQDLKAALAEFLQFREGARREDPIKAAERAIIGQKVGIDFFPTPAGVAARMAQLARIQPGDRVLEPSAGNGNLADAARAAGGEVEVIEISSELRKILEAKGYTVAAHDFDTFVPEEPFDAVIMNPPFSARRDADHVMRAFGMLKPGGRLAAIAGEGVFIGSDAKAVQFRDWLDRHGADVESLEQGTFMDRNLLATTGANGRLIVLQK